MGEDATIDVAAGVIFRAGKLLITQRPPPAHLAGLWEFPGGKREPGETFEDCLHRELKEELAIEVRIKGALDFLTHQYPGKSVRLKFFHCHWLRHEPQALGCAQFAWVSHEALVRYEFPAADIRLLEKVRLQWPVLAEDR